MSNIDKSTVDSFGDEWERFDQSNMTSKESKKIFNDYFEIFPWEAVNGNSVGFDMGCGSGRWAKFVAPRVGHLNCIDPSSAIFVAEKSLRKYDNITFVQGSVSDNSVKHNSQDFGYSLGVLHHVPNTKKAINSCVELLKPGAPFLLYLYYFFDNKPKIYKFIWYISNIFRRAISLFPSPIKNLSTDFIALIVYFPLARTSKFIEKIGLNSSNIPLSYYKDTSFYVMRTDSRDRFGTPLEKRFSKLEIEKMMLESGLRHIKFSNHEPYWCAVGFKKHSQRGDNAS